MAINRNWKPVLRGNTYCSPACGGKCTRASYERCVRDAKELAEHMGKGWKTHVHENLGWFYSVSKGEPINRFHNALLEITPPRYGDGMYTAWVQTSPQFIVHHPNAKIALRKAIAQFDAYIDSLSRAREQIKDALK